MRYQSSTRQKKTFKVAHMEPGQLHLDFILLPFGYSYNSDIAVAKKGDTIRFADGGEYAIEFVKKIPLNKSFADMLCRIRYGITLSGAMSRWKMNARMEGHSEMAISQDECLWVVFTPNE